MSSSSYMIPQPGDTSINLPITFDYEGGRTQKLRSRLLWSVLVLLGIIIFVVITLFSGMNFLMKIVFSLVWVYVGLWIIRFPMLGEKGRRAEAKKRLDNDFEIAMRDIWNIFEIDGNICYFRNGYKGVFVLLEKGAIVGQDETRRYEHYEAISDALNIAGSSNMKVVQIDHMAGIGQDDRIRQAHKLLSTYGNDKLTSVISSIFRNVQKRAENSFTTYDIYLFMSKGSLSELDDNVRKVIGCFTSANYSNYSYLDRDQIRVVANEILNMSDFSVSYATRESFKQRRKNQIITIEERYADGSVVKVNDTRDQAEEKNNLKIKQARADQKVLARRRAEKEKAIREAKKASRKPSKKSRNEIDLIGTSQDSTNETTEDIIDLTGGVSSQAPIRKLDEDEVIEL